MNAAVFILGPGVLYIRYSEKDVGKELIPHLLARVIANYFFSNDVRRHVGREHKTNAFHSTGGSQFDRI